MPGSNSNGKREMVLPYDIPERLREKGGINMFRKKLVPMVLIGCVITTCLPGSVYAAVDDASGWGQTSYVKEAAAANAAEPSDSASDFGSTSSADIPATGGAVTAEPKAEDLERIIAAVKSKITVSEKLSVFDYNFNTESYDSSAYWRLNWSTEDYSESITVRSDQEGNILYYYSINNNDGSYALKYLKSELKETAGRFIKKVAPDIYNKIEYVDSSSEGTYSGQYTYQYQRVENGVPMPDNMVTVGVNYETGKVVYFDASWLYEVEIPSADTKITKQEAAEKIGKTVAMKLAYQNAYTTDEDGNTKIKAFLVYSPDNSYVAVDAKTGEVYTTQNEWIDRGENGYGSAAEEKEAADSSTANGGQSLTEEEILKVDEIKGLISKENAIKAVTGNKSLLLEDNLKSISAKLYKQDNFYRVGEDTKYIWSISLSDPREINKESGDTYRASANANVDAVTGKIISFYASVKEYYDISEKEWETVKVKYSSDQGQKILEGFLKEQIPDKFEKSVLTDNSESYIIAYKDDKEVYGGYSYNYDRVNEGINYSYNGIYGSVDGVTGKIYSFSYNWNDNVTFESPKSIISATDAFKVYISNEGYHLAYEINSIHSYDGSEKDVISTEDYSIENEVRLVYRTDISPAYFSPFTGKQLNYDGEEYALDENIYNYSDIKDVASSRNIRLLADIGIGFKGGEFKPDKAVTTGELTEFLNLADIYYNDGKYQIKKDNSTITRLAVSKFAVQVLGYESIAKLKGIYNISFQDQDQISQEYLGYVALAQGLNLITGNGNNEFRPNDKLTRVEAADMLIAMLSVEK